MGVEDPLQMLDTEQGDIALEKKQDSDQMMRTLLTHRLLGGHRRAKTREGQHVSEEKADKRSKKSPVLLSAEEEKKLVDFLHDNEIFFNKHLMDYKDRSMREAVG